MFTARILYTALALGDLSSLSLTHFYLTGGRETSETMRVLLRPVVSQTLTQLTHLPPDSILKIIILGINCQ